MNPSLLYNVIGLILPKHIYFGQIAAKSDTCQIQIQSSVSHVTVNVTICELRLNMALSKTGQTPLYPYVFKPQHTYVQNNCNRRHGALDWMCWIQQLSSQSTSVLEVLSIRHNKEDLDYTKLLRVQIVLMFSRVYLSRLPAKVSGSHFWDHLFTVEECWKEKGKFSSSHLRVSN